MKTPRFGQQEADGDGVAMTGDILPWRWHTPKKSVRQYENYKRKGSSTLQPRNVHLASGLWYYPVRYRQCIWPMKTGGIGMFLHTAHIGITIWSCMAKIASSWSRAPVHSNFAIQNESLLQILEASRYLAKRRSSLNVTRCWCAGRLESRSCSSHPNRNLRYFVFPKPP